MMLHRRSIRYEGFDYSSEGVYFVTLVTHHRDNLFGRIENGGMHLNEFGMIVREEWFKTAILRPNTDLDEDEFVVMPNHVHGIIRINQSTNQITSYGQGEDIIVDSRCKGDLQCIRQGDR